VIRLISAAKGFTQEVEGFNLDGRADASELDKWITNG